MKNTATQRVRHSGIWQPKQFECVTGSVASGSPMLDSQLGGGWRFEQVYQVGQQQSEGLFSLMMPAIYRMMEQKRWLILISPPKSVVQQFRNLPQFDASRLLVVHSKDDIDVCWAMEGAIRNRTAACIFSWASQVDQRDIKRLKLAARQSNSLNVIIDQQANCGLSVHSYASETQQLAFDALIPTGHAGISPRFH